MMLLQFITEHSPMMVSTSAAKLCVATSSRCRAPLSVGRPMTTHPLWRRASTTSIHKHKHFFHHPTNYRNSPSQQLQLLQQSTTRQFSKKKPIPRIPRKAALNLTPKARTTFQKLIEATNSQGIILRYQISSQHALRMAFKFDLIKDLNELSVDDEGVSLEVLPDGTPKPPSESWNDNLPKLYIHHGAFMKVLGGTLDVELNAETGELKPKLFDREGHEMDPNA